MPSALPAGDPSPADGSLPEEALRDLIERALPYQLDAQTRFELAPDGVRCRIAVLAREAEAEGG